MTPGAFPRIQQAKIDWLVRSVGRAVRYSFYDWTRDMPPWKRILIWSGILIQGYAIYAAFTRSLLWPFMWPRDGVLLIASLWLLYVVGGWLINATLTSEFVRKTQLESDLVAARRIQETLHPETIEAVPGFEIETFYKPFRGVGGDYFDVIELSGERTLFALADVSGKGISAALLAANLQALVRSMATVDPDPLTLATQINRHVNRHTPNDRFVTAVFIVLTHASGAMTYVNAGHNAPIISGAACTTLLDATGMPLGLFPDGKFEAGTATLRPGEALVVFSDGLPDSIRSDDPHVLVCETVAGGSATSMSSLTRLVDGQLNTDDITILLVKRPPTLRPSTPVKRWEG